jgi:hypothetical protein
MNVDPESSLDRFLRNRAPAYIGQSGAKAAVALNGSIGTLFTLGGIGMMVTSVVINDPGMFIGAIGPLIGGGINLGVARMMFKRKQQFQPLDIKLTDEATQFIHHLMKLAFGWRYRWVGWEGMNPGIGGMRRYRRHLLFHSETEPPVGADQRAAKLLLRDDLYTALDNATQQYNRIYGLLTASDIPQSSTVGKRRPTILHAIDEAMADILHQAALLDKYPESKIAAAQVITERTATMKETADRMESLVSQAPQVIPTEKPLTALESVLEDLKLSDIAESELNAPSCEPPQIQIKQ